MVSPRGPKRSVGAPPIGARKRSGERGGGRRTAASVAGPASAVGRRGPPRPGSAAGPLSPRGAEAAVERPGREAARGEQELERGDVPPARARRGSPARRAAAGRASRAPRACAGPRCRRRRGRGGPGSAARPRASAARGRRRRSPRRARAPAARPGAPRRPDGPWRAPEQRSPSGPRWQSAQQSPPPHRRRGARPQNLTRPTSLVAGPRVKRGTSLRIAMPCAGRDLSAAGGAAAAVVGARLGAPAAHAHRAPGGARVGRAVVERPAAQLAAGRPSGAPSCRRASPRRRRRGCARSPRRRRRPAGRARRRRAGSVGSSRARRAARSSTARACGSCGSPLLASSSERSASRTSRAAARSAAAPSAGSRLRSSHSAKPGAVVEQVGAVLAVDGVDERLHDPQRPGRRLAAAGVHEAGQQRFAFHAASLARREYGGACGRLGRQGR